MLYLFVNFYEYLLHVFEVDGIPVVVVVVVVVELCLIFILI